jgi:hypothetical protein
MDSELQKIGVLFRVTAGQLRRLGKGPIRTERNSTSVIEAYLYSNEIRTAAAFPPDRCVEAANLLEEFAERLEAAARLPRSQD